MDLLFYFIITVLTLNALLYLGVFTWLLCKYSVKQNKYINNYKLNRLPENWHIINLKTFKGE